MSGADSRPLRMPENTSVKIVSTVSAASATCVHVEPPARPARLHHRFRASASRCSQTAVSENTNHDCVESPRPSSSHSVKRSGDRDQRPSSQASPMNTTSSPQ